MIHTNRTSMADIVICSAGSGLVSGFVSLNRGHNRRNMKETLDGCWRACTQDVTPVERPFIADAIIANPPSFAHVHCAEALGIPVHITSGELTNVFQT